MMNQEHKIESLVKKSFFSFFLKFTKIFSHFLVFFFQIFFNFSKNGQKAKLNHLAKNDRYHEILLEMFYMKCVNTI